MDSIEIAAVKAFMAAINTGNADRLSDLMTDDHTFVDSTGRTAKGRQEMTKGWAGYFQLFPDYLVEFDTIIQQGNQVAVFGSAAGTYNGKRGLVAENRIEMPAAWKAIVENGKVKLWQVYADWSEGSKIIEADSETEADS